MTKKPIVFSVGGRRYNCLRFEELTFEEGLELKGLTGGMAPVEVLARMAVKDPDAWIGMIVLSMRRTRPEASPSELMNENLLAIIDAIDQASAAALRAEAMAKGPDADPPPEPASDDEPDAPDKDQS